mgnify:CR=1 FL=1
MMTDETAEGPLTLTDEQIVTRRRALGLAVAAVGATALVGRSAYADDMDTDSEGEDEDDIDTEDDMDEESEGDSDG